MAPRKSTKKAAGPTPVEATVHADKRVNLPTADAQVFVTPEVEEIKQLRWERDPSLDPQLVWKGKDDNADELLVDAPPIYIQEKIDPRVLIENLRKTAKADEPEPEYALFDTFDGLDELDTVDFYKHDANWANRMILGDSLQVMASLADREQLRGKVQMIYIDPPYGIKFGSNWQASARSRDVKDGKLESASREAEQIKAFRDTWELGIGSYLTYLRDRLVVARDLLTESGSVFVQIGDQNVHLVRSVLDEVFGSENFAGQIAFRTTTSATGVRLGGTVDYLLWYAKAIETVKYRQLFRQKAAGGDGGGAYTNVEIDGTRRRLTIDERERPETVSGRIFRLDNLTSQSAGRQKGEGAASWFPVEIDGRMFRPTMQSRWKTNEIGMSRLVAARRVSPGRDMLAYVRFLDDFPAFAISNFWDDTTTGSGLDKVYVVQTNTRVIERCLLMCTDPGDLVLDPTCGSGTTAFVAEQWGRRWITIDSSRVALALARQRLMGGKFPYYLLADSSAGRWKEGELLGKPLPDASVTDDIRHGFVYERVQHITLKSIANNPDIKEGMNREEIDAAIKRHAEYEVLVDRPYEDKSIVRVSGPFTVESLSPHRALSFGDQPVPTVVELPAEVSDEATFTQTILDNLAKAGIQNGQRAERIELASLESYPGSYVQAVGDRRHESDATSRIAFAIGPQYGTVSPAFVKAATREALEMPDVDTLCVLGFAFDPNTVNSVDASGAVDVAGRDFAEVAGERKLGRMPVLLVRMNVDLLMGEDLKKTGAGNLFTVFGEPDIDVRQLPTGEIEVELKGVDVYDPNTGSVRSNSTDQIALWMIDTDYNDESFFVRHCYFTGGGDPFKRLKTALKADIDADAWASLYSTVSRPFPKPETGKIAVKVINDYGDEVVKVLEV